MTGRERRAAMLTLVPFAIFLPVVTPFLMNRWAVGVAVTLMAMTYLAVGVVIALDANTIPHDLLEGTDDEGH